MKQIPKWKTALRIISALLYIIAFAAVTFCALRGVGAIAVILLMFGANAFLAVFCGVTADIANEEDCEFYEKLLEEKNKVIIPYYTEEFVRNATNESQRQPFIPQQEYISEMSFYINMSEEGAPCEFPQYIDKVAKFCDKDEKCSTCDVVYCWYRVFNDKGKNNVKNGG